jgi:hypothetical protein
MIKMMIPFVSEPESCFVCYVLLRSYHITMDKLDRSFLSSWVNLNHHELYSRFHLGFQNDVARTNWCYYDMSRNLRRQICRNMYSIQ